MRIGGKTGRPYSHDDEVERYPMKKKMHEIMDGGWAEKSRRWHSIPYLDLCQTR